LYQNLVQPIHPDDFISGDYSPELISLGKIKKVPTTLWFFEGDALCPIEKNMRLHTETKTETTAFINPTFGHMYPLWIQGDMWLSKVVAAIETGDPSRRPEFNTTAYTHLENVFWNVFEIETREVDEFILQ